MDLRFSGLSSEVSHHLSKVDLRVSHRTVQDQSTEYAGVMERLANTVTPMVWEQCMADEIYMSIRGESKYLFSMLDSEARLCIAKTVAGHN